MLVAWWSANRLDAWHEIRERWGYDPHENHRATLGSVYILLRERVLSQFGYVLGNVDLPPEPEFCDFVYSVDPHADHREAAQAWRESVDAALCASDRLTTVDDLEEWLGWR